MADNEQDIAALLVQASAALKAIADAKSASDGAKEAAKQSYKDVLRLIARHAISTYEGRTAALTGLIVELGEATANIPVDNQMDGQMTEISDLADQALELFKKEKKAG